MAMVEAQSISTNLPVLQVIETIDSAGGGFFVEHSTVGIGPNGDLAAPTPFGQRPMISRPLGGPAISFGTFGEGPEEFRFPLIYEVTDSTIIVFDRGSSRLSEWSMSGQLVSERRIRAPSSSNVVPLSGRGWLIAEPRQEGLRLVLVDRLTGTGAVIAPSDDSLVRAHWANARMVATNPPALGAWPGGIVVAQRNTYEVAFYNHAGDLVGIARPEDEPNVLGPEGIAALERNLATLGRTLSPSRRATLASEARPWIRAQIRSDQAGRTWALGQRGDDAFFDVFAGPAYLGRIALDCPLLGSRWDLSGQWIAVICAPEDPSSSFDSQIRILKIVER